MKYDFRKIEEKWRKIWDKEGIYEPKGLRPASNGRNYSHKAKKPFYNLMMFPYPSAEGLHVGNMYAFTGSDIYGRFKRMQGYDVFEPIGLDGFGIHSENYALKIGKHPFQHAKDSEKNFYRQLRMIGNGFAWRERLETYDPDYYKWTQWIFTEMFRHGLAYRKKQPVNWCPSCKTVLADEQVINGECERCSSKIVKKELEQWFFRITDYAERLLQNLEKLDWSEKVKIAQRNWIGKSEGAELKFEIVTDKISVNNADFVFLHAFKSNPQRDFWPWLAKEVKNRGGKVFAPALPNPSEPNIEEQVKFLLNKHRFTKNSVIVTHSLGGVLAMKLLPRLKVKINKLVMVAPPLRPEFLDGDKRPALHKACDWKFDFKSIKSRACEFIVLADEYDSVIPSSQPAEIAKKLAANFIVAKAQKSHFRGSIEPEVANVIFPKITVFTTRPDTLFGATYLVLAPEHELISNLKPYILNWREVQNYINKAKNKSEEERIAEGREKTGVELKGVKAINPANKKKIPIWVADYVLSGYGTGAIMAVPAHDERDWEFAQKYKLPAVMVVRPNYSEKIRPVLKEAYLGSGRLIASGKFNGMESEKAKWAITKEVGGVRKNQYRLRDWLISRQRYWGPPIPMIFCNKCGWQAVPKKDLPVKLPYLKNFKPMGTGKSPLASIKSFYETKCPVCGGKARRETDVSDTFLDSAWYYLRYPSVGNKKQAWDPKTVEKWLPVNMYIGGAEHSVLHLLYVRFLALALHDMKLLNFGPSPAPKGEPFPKFRAHGLLIKEGAKMSKSKGNVVNPDEYIQKFGADVLRMYLMFLAPLTQGGDFRDEGIAGITRFLERVWKFNEVMSVSRNSRESSTEILRVWHQTIKKVSEDIEALRYNTAISALMILLNKMESAPETVPFSAWKDFLKMIAPFAPFISEELWSRCGFSGSIHSSSWPVYDPKFLKIETVKIAVQVNGKTRDVLTLDAGTNQEKVEKIALASDKVKKFLEGKKPRRVIYVSGRLINFVV